MELRPSGYRGPLRADPPRRSHIRRLGSALRTSADAANVVTALLLLRNRIPAPDRGDAARPVLLAQLRGWSRWAVVVAFVLLQATNIATVTVAGLFVSRDLHAPLLWAGMVLGVAALMEIPALLVIGRLHERVPVRVLLATGWTAGVLYYGLVLLVHQPWQLLVLQPLNAAFFATVVGVGLTVFQAIFPNPGLASGLFTNTRRVGAILAGALIAALGTSPAPYRALFGGAAVIVALGLVGAATVTAVGARSDRLADAR